MTPARKMALILSALTAMAGGAHVAREGWVLKGYPDPVHGAKVPTACDGVTEGVVLGRVYTEAECVQMSLIAKVKHAAPIASCIEHEMPVAFLAEQTDMAFNIGVGKPGGKGGFLNSTMCRQMRAGDYQAACDAILLYYRAGSLDCRTDRRCRGLWLRRQEAHKRCSLALQ